MSLAEALWLPMVPLEIPIALVEFLGPCRSFELQNLCGDVRPGVARSEGASRVRRRRRAPLLRLPGQSAGHCHRLWRSAGS